MFQNGNGITEKANPIGVFLLLHMVFQKDTLTKQLKVKRLSLAR